MSREDRHDIFTTTRWTMVLKAGGASGEASAMALQELCKVYWYPLYAYVRHRGYSKEDAEDVVQAFFALLLRQEDFTGLDPQKGRFRAFLLAALKHYMAKEYRKASALKRGGDVPHLSLDWEQAGVKYELVDKSAESPEQFYDRQWATALLQHVLARLKEEWRVKDKVSLFDTLKVFLTVEKDDEKYAETAARHGFSESYLRVNTHRLRKRYRELLRDEISQTLESGDMVEDEIRALFGAFR